MKPFVAELVRGDRPVRATGIANPAGRSWIVGDVRLDGRAELRDALGAAGVATAATATDAELVMGAWTAWRETATERLLGDFSFALWDARRRVLLCARDTVGVNPLYWAEIGRTFVCSNVLDEVRAHPGVTSRLHEPAIASFLRHGFNDDTATTSFAAINRLPPAHQLFVAAGGTITPQRHSSFPAPEPLRLRRAEEYVERFRDVLGRAVRDRLPSDHAAVLLSGGLDSTTLAATARRVAPATAIHAWTSAPPPPLRDDERPLAAAVAARLGMRHEIESTNAVPLAHLQDPDFRSVEPLDEPAWGPWCGLLRRISACDRVLLVGEDGDALFRPPGLVETLRRWPARDVLRRTVAYVISHRRLPHLGSGLKRFLTAAPAWRSRAADANAWIRPHALALARPRPSRSEPHPSRADAHRLLSDPVWQSVLEQAQPAYTGVPLRFAWPLLDTRVIEFVFSIPPVPWCQSKELLRCASRGDLPEAVLARRKAPLHGYYEWQVARWRAARGPASIVLGDGVREFVDTQRVVDTLRNGSVEAVLAAWRALALDQWLRRL